MNKKEIFEELKKAIYKSIAKAYKGGNTVVKRAVDELPSKEKHTVKHIIEDINDPNMVAEMPHSHIKATPENVLRKEYEKGVHISKNPDEPGRSLMGIFSRIGENEGAKREARRVISEQKKIKPKLPDESRKPTKEIITCPKCGHYFKKSEEIEKAEGDKNLQALHNAKEAQAKAILGISPIKPPKMGKANMGQVFMSEKDESGLARLRKFLGKREEKKKSKLL